MLRALLLLLLLLLLLCHDFSPTLPPAGDTILTAPRQLGHMATATCNLLTTNYHLPTTTCQLPPANCQLEKNARNAAIFLVQIMATVPGLTPCQH